jgi:hypothetical protein
MKLEFGWRIAAPHVTPQVACRPPFLAQRQRQPAMSLIMDGMTGGQKPLGA